MTNRWYRKLVNGDEDTLFKRVNVKASDIPVCLEEKHPIEGEKPIKTFGVFSSEYSLFLEIANTPQPKRCFYEIIRGGCYQKHYVDIDMSLEDDVISEDFAHTIEEKLNISKIIVKEYIDIMLRINPSIKKEDILVFNSNSEKKRSFHIIVDRWCFTSATQNKDFFNEIMEHIPIPHRKYFDKTMYKCIQQFRIFLSTKCGKNRVKTLDSQSTWKPLDNITDSYLLLKEIFMSSLVTSTACSCRIIPCKYKEKIEYVNSRDMENGELASCLALFRTFKDSHSFEIMDLKGTIIPVKRRCSSYCNACNRVHENENGYLYLTFDNNLYFNCRRNDQSTLIGNINDFGRINPTTGEIISKVDEYVPPSVGHSVDIRPLIDDGILELKSEKSKIKPYTESQLICQPIQQYHSSEVISNKKEIKKEEVTESEISEFALRMRNAKMKHNPSTKREKPDKILSRAFNSIAATL